MSESTCQPVRVHGGVCWGGQGAGQLGRLRTAGPEGCLTSGRNLYRGRRCLADALRPFSRWHKVKQVAANELR